MSQHVLTMVQFPHHALWMKMFKFNIVRFSGLHRY